MIIIIDGYNLLKQVFPGNSKNLEKQKKIFIKHLAFYRTKKMQSISEIIIVFDAGPSNHAQRTVRSGIVVVYSGTKSTADDWIIDFVTRNRNKEIHVIKLDRELREICQKIGADWLSVYEFYKILEATLLEAVYTTSQHLKKQALKKYESVEYNAADLEGFDQSAINTEVLDLLVEQTSQTMPREKDHHAQQEQTRVRNPETLSKEAKKIHSKIKKL